MKGWRFPLFGIVIGVIVATWLYPIAVQLVRQTVPTSHWFEVHSLKVGSVETGGLPIVRLDRTVRRPFSVNWILTLRRGGEYGLFVFCRRTGNSDILYATDLPEISNLGDWLRASREGDCPPLAVGTYILSIAWELEVEGHVRRVVRTESNLFEVIE